MVKPVKDVALAIEEQDARLLAALPESDRPWPSGSSPSSAAR